MGSICTALHWPQSTKSNKNENTVGYLLKITIEYFPNYVISEKKNLFNSSQQTPIKCSRLFIITYQNRR